MISDQEGAPASPVRRRTASSRSARGEGQRGFFAVLEGVDGSGKTGALAHLKAGLEPLYPDLVATREPGGTAEGNAVRGLLLSSGSLRWQPMAELLLVAAARVQHVAAVIHPALDSGKVVISDRFVGSTLAYQGAGHGLSARDIREIHDMTTGGLWPDLTVVLDLDPQKALERSMTRLGAGAIDEGRFESLDLSFHRRVRENFLDQAAADPARHKVINGDQPLHFVQDEVLRVVGAALSSVGFRRQS